MHLEVIAYPAFMVLSRCINKEFEYWSFIVNFAHSTRSKSHPVPNESSDISTYHCQSSDITASTTGQYTRESNSSELVAESSVASGYSPRMV
jgi:hypothetical protein